MELVKVNEKTKIDVRTGTIYECTCYELGQYEVDHKVKTRDGEVISDRVEVCRDWTRKFLPQIDFEEDYYGTGHRVFTVRTSGFTELEAEDIREAIAGLQEALEAVEILTKQFC